MMKFYVFLIAILVGFAAGMDAGYRKPVFVLYRAEVGDYEFLGLYSSREEGEKVGDEYRRWHADRIYEVKPYPIDYCKGFVLGPTYTVHVRKSSEKMERCGVEADVRDPVKVEAYEWGSDSIEVISPTSYEHAERVAVAARHRWLDHQELQ